MSLLICLYLVLGLGPTFPYDAAGLTERQAAVHLLNRFSFGPRPGEVDDVLAQGLENWFRAQMEGQLPDRELTSRLAELSSFGKTDVEILSLYPDLRRVARMAQADGVIEDARDFRKQRRELMEYGRKKGFRTRRELIHDLMSQKVLRAVYGENQLREVLTDFWFNHFNVSLTDNRARVFVLSYENEAIRPFVTAAFEDMLLATAKHPAMLLYLDNAFSSADAQATTSMELALTRGQAKRPRNRKAKKKQGINENYARELMELHTLGVDGGYSQEDIVAVARAFTGWTVLPPDRFVSRNRKRRARKVGFVQDGLFLFRADQHDAGAKTILDTHFPKGGGLNEGKEIILLLAHHPSTARFVTSKFARRFVSDNPPASLLARLEQDFRDSGGDLSRLVTCLVHAPEFWAEASVNGKIKSPFQVATSAIRALDGQVTEVRSLVDWIKKMGQPLYACQAPTGFPDRASFWINSGALVNRMGFAIALADGSIAGVTAAAPRLAAEKLEGVAALLLPERDLSRSLGAIRKAAEQNTRLTEKGASGSLSLELLASYGMTEAWRETPLPPLDGDLASRWTGLLLGSPDFQRF